jgi:uncharacterized membrane protein YedE/YeeE
VLNVVGACVLGIIFGFVLQRGGFCGSSLLSTVILFKDRKGLVAILVAVLVSMVGFAVLAELGWVITNPKPMRLLSAVIGGIAFGVGMVLAGGCVTGTLYKAGEGRLTSMLALVSLGIGSVLVDQGLLKPMKRAVVMATREIRWSASLDEVVGVSYPLIAGIIGGVGLIVILAVYLARRKSLVPKIDLSAKKIISGSWSPVTSGLVIGVLGWVAYLLSSAAGRNYPLGGHGGVKGAFQLITGGETSSSTWMMFLVGGIIVGSAISARMRGTLKLRSADPATLLFALLGGVLLGIGASIGRGCFIGNGVSGLALLSLHSMIFAVCTVAANWVTTAIYLRGLR